MTSLPTLVIAGYGSWAKAQVNPAAEVLKQLAEEHWQQCRVVLLEVPVASDELAATIEKTLLELKPAAWLGLGIAAGAHVIKPEMVGVNWLHFRVPDIKGYNPRLQRIEKHGPVAYEATLPNRAIVDALNAASIPAILSFSAGTHMCNQMLYSTRHFVEQHQLDTLCGFIHIPQSAENVSKERRGQPTGINSLPLPSMPQQLMGDAIKTAIEVICQQLNSTEATAAIQSEREVPDGVKVNA